MRRSTMLVRFAGVAGSARAEIALDVSLSPGSIAMDARVMRRKFMTRLFRGVRVVWPILSILLMLIVALGVGAGVREGWSVQESVYFSFVSGLTIGYGDFAPTTLTGRTFAIMIGICGILATALIAAVAVKALTDVQGERDE